MKLPDDDPTAGERPAAIAAPAMTRRQLAQGAGAAAAALTAASVWPRVLGQAMGAGAPGRRPSVVLILADDLGYGEVGCYGQARIATPNLDRLAAEGVRFTDCYSGAPVCAPSRCSLLTGLHTGHARVRSNYGDLDLRQEDATFGEVLQAAGYRTALIGKWGFGPDDPPESGARTPSHPNAKGFDEFFGYLGHHHAHDYYPDHLWEDDRRVPIPENQPNGPGAQHRFAPDLLAERALAYIRRNRDAPFLLFLSLPLPHAPNNPPSDGPYAGEDWPAGERAHAAQITLLDRYVGDVAEELRRTGLAEDTLLLVTSDNGPHREGGDDLYEGEDHGRTHDPGFFDGTGGLRGIKRSLYEGGIRVPMIAWGAGAGSGAGPGTVSDEPWAFWDVLPTLADLAGIAPPGDVDGISRREQLLGRPQAAPDRPLYWYRLDYVDERSQLADAVRHGTWKAVRFTPAPPPSVWRQDAEAMAPGQDAVVELYDLATDPGETHDVAGAHPAQVRELVALMDAAWEPPPFARRPWRPEHFRPDGRNPSPPPPGPGADPGRGGTPVSRRTLRVRVRPRVHRAARAKRSIHVRLTSRERVTHVGARLFRRLPGRRITVARGRLPAVDGRATLRLQATRRVRKGRYPLRLIGRNADGSRAVKTVPLRFE